ncbi:MAG: acetyl-CoA C-acyltransferase [Roseivirga sp.]
MSEVYIISTARTPIGSFGGSLSSLSAVQLGTHAIDAAIQKAKLDRARVDEVLIGNVVSANLGQAPARQAAMKAGLPESVPCTTINKVCSSGMKATMLGAQAIALGQADLIVAGGMESMSNTPYYLPKARNGYKYGHGNLVDGLMHDGLWEAYHEFPMGNCADHTAKEMSISREAQDAYTIASYERAREASDQGLFDAEIAGLSIPQKRRPDLLIDRDEEIDRVKFEKIPNLKPVFSKEGTVTAANASTINDGASALILASEKAVKAHQLKPIAKILAYADAAQAPLWFTTSPAKAIRLAMKRAGVTAADIDYYEINEAFAVVALANMELLNLTTDQVNVLGGAVAIGHPLGCSGARIIGSLTTVLSQKSASVGVAGICNGGGGASALVIENLS